MKVLIYIFVDNTLKQHSSTFKLRNLGSNYPYLLHTMSFVDSLTHITVSKYLGVHYLSTLSLTKKFEPVILLSKSRCAPLGADGRNVENQADHGLLSVQIGWNITNSKFQTQVLLWNNPSHSTSVIYNAIPFGHGNG